MIECSEWARLEDKYALLDMHWRHLQCCHGHIENLGEQGYGRGKGVERAWRAQATPKNSRNGQCTSRESMQESQIIEIKYI